jgi:DNA-binding CsgD family transcriptional regulator
MQTVWPLVGREEELQLVTDALVAGSGGLVLSGAAGVGKTRLAAEAVAVAEKHGYTSRWVVATRAASSIPFGALVGLLPPPVRTSNDQLDILRQGIDSLAQSVDGQKIVLIVDDAHLLDDSSAVFVHQVVVRRVAFVIVTLRTGEPVPEPVAALWKEGQLQRFEVQSLSELELQDLLSKALGDQVSRATRYELWTGSRGNPLLLKELVLGGIETGALRLRDGVWRSSAALAGSPRLIEAIESRIGRLEPDEREILELLALGEPIGIQTLERLVGIDALERVEGKGLVEVETDGRRTRAHFSHPLYGEVLRASIPTIRARSVTRKLAETYQKISTRRRDDVLRLATFCLEGGEVTNPKLLTDAALRAIGAFDYVLAERLARAAVEAGGGFNSSFALADALRSQGRAEEADVLLRKLQEDAGEEDECVDAAVLRVYNLFFGLDKGAEAEQVMRDAAGKVSADNLDKFAAQEAILHLYGGRPVDALKSASRVLDRSRQEENDPALMEAILAGATAAAISGKAALAQTIFERGQAILPLMPLESSAYLGQLLAVQFLLLWLSGDIPGAENIAEVTYQGAVAQRSHDGMALLATALGQAALAEGRVRTAAERLREAAALLRDVDRNRHLPWCLGALTRAYALSGDLPAADEAMAEADAARPVSVGLFAVENEVSRAWLEWAHGRETNARRQAIAAADMAATTGQTVFEATALYDAARLGEARQAAPRLKSVAETIDVKTAPPFSHHALGIAESDAKALESASETLEKMGMLLAAADAAAAAAAIHQKDGKLGSAYGLSMRARELAAKCEGALTPALAGLEGPSILTPREQEIVMLAARGLSSKEIADQLVVSVRTVDNHLHRAYSKLGVDSREELSEVLGTRGTAPAPS